MHNKKDNEVFSHHCKFIEQYILNRIIYKIIVWGDQTENKYSIIEITFPSGEESEIPLHKHGNEILIIHVIEGIFSFRYGEETLEGNKDTVLKFEKNTSHSYRKIGRDQGKLLVTYTPAGLEGFFRELGTSTIKDTKKSIQFDPVILHLLESNYNWRFIFE
ncbi:cupin domain-containing protein [Candidatus Nitrosocosmicus agrestis]|jgi:quercetin dioxygenase-like cupin family protein|uniref:cupin domain-containing protein n=1 Tax=Candidatus Nitrosocosmicus agrestis TaxID=2563600 RepID=UPI00122E7FAE|nr:cupin domain-containing protein [Candidatus Nitrosocosmicus sp. SS]KAA2279012.1 cupin domain-containing protein [Candidatus Nitrosocosmicus sp. SS]KAF0867585.1 cupin domain-containing protein [Candidatus Nitrosocosmicus sp. SS]